MTEKDELKNIVLNFETSGTLFADGKRNKIKLFEHHGTILNIKSFKIPIFFNQIIYRYFRDSKAKRSFENAKKLLQLDILTPKPIDYLEFYNAIGLQKSFYICEHLKIDYSILDVLHLTNQEIQMTLLQKFAQFTFDLHEKGVEFLDHSPGNTLLVKNKITGDFDFYLVDLNRMKFHGKKLDFATRIKNLSRIASTEMVIKIISNQYSAFYKDIPEPDFYDALWQKTQQFQSRFYRKKKLKKRYLFK